MIDNLARITDHVSTASTLPDAIQAVAMFSSFSGKPSRLFLGRVQSNFEVTHQADIGFNPDFTNFKSYGEIVSGVLMAGYPALSSLDFIPHNTRYDLNFRELIGSSDDNQWNSSVFMLLSPDHVAVLSTIDSIVDSKDHANYFNVIKSLISLFLRIALPNEVKARSSAVRQDGMEIDVTLTERQLVILQMIESGQTNASIADRMGYSESLIRQETIAIYRKLGITGRKDLKIDD